MILLILGIALWWVPHLVKIWMPDRRAAAVARIGEGPWKAVVALATLLAVALMVVGYRQAQDDPTILWTAPLWFWHLNNLLMIVAVFIFIAGFFASPVRRAIRNPQLTAVKIWAVAHLLVNGDLASIILFGGLLAWAVVAVIGIKRRDGPRRERPEWTTGGLITHLTAGAVLFVVTAAVHVWLGASPFPG